MFKINEMTAHRISKPNKNVAFLHIDCGDLLSDENNEKCLSSCFIISRIPYVFQCPCSLNAIERFELDAQKLAKLDINLKTARFKND